MSKKTLIITTLQSNKAMGSDGMSCFLIKTFAEELTPAWHSLFQISLDLHRVLELWKKNV